MISLVNMQHSNYRMYVDIKKKQQKKESLGWEWPLVAGWVLDFQVDQLRKHSLPSSVFIWTFL